MSLELCPLLWGEREETAGDKALPVGRYGIVVWLLLPVPISGGDRGCSKAQAR